jgi:hypothetical protein
MKNPFEKFFKKVAKTDSSIKGKDSYEELKLPKIYSEMLRDDGIIQLEFDMINASGISSFEEIHLQASERSLHFGRAKIVLGSDC